MLTRSEYLASARYEINNEPNDWRVACEALANAIAVGPDGERNIAAERLSADVGFLRGTRWAAEKVRRDYPSMVELAEEIERGPNT